MKSQLTEYKCYYSNIDEDKLNQSLLARVVFDKSIEGMFVTDRNGMIKIINPAFTDITGYYSDEIIGRHIMYLRPEAKHSKAFYFRMEEELIEKGQWRGEVWTKHKNNNITKELVTINAAYDYKGEPQYYIVVFHDVNKILEENNLAAQKGYYDILTGLPNRQLLRDRISIELKKAYRQKKYVAILILDIDDFKKVNTELSRKAGDEILSKITDRIQRCVREEDTLARTGGDEFTILLSQIELPENTAEIARRIFAELRKPFIINSKEIFLTPSMGVSIYPHDGNNIGSILQNADLALLKAKNTYKNNFQFYTDSIHRKAEKRLETETNLRYAIKNKNITAYYQPIIDLQRNKIVGTEVLARWQLGDTVVSPDLFIPLAEETGLIIPIGEGIIHNALTQSECWKKEYNWNLQFSINLSPKQLLSENLLKFIDNILSETEISPSTISLEITENSLIENVKQSKHILKKLKEKGISISLDDFGTGYSSLNYLREFSIDYIKIDKSFVSNIHTNSKNASIVTAIISMAHSMDIRVIAEGIETKKQAYLLRKNGCDCGQGFLFSKPVPPEKLEIFLYNSVKSEI